VSKFRPLDSYITTANGTRAPIAAGHCGLFKGTITKSRYGKSFAVPAFAALSISPMLAQAQLVDLGATTGYALNNSGVVALASGLYSNGTVTALPALPGWTTPATPLALNASGQAAGSAVPATGYPAGVAIEFSGGTLTNLTPGYTAPRDRDNLGHADHDHGRAIHDAYVEIAQRNQLYRDRRRRRRQLGGHEGDERQSAGNRGLCSRHVIPGIDLWDHLQLGHQRALRQGVR
jgi:hypothetical protein